jgi:hypothetical protein
VLVRSEVLVVEGDEGVESLPDRVGLVVQVVVREAFGHDELLRLGAGAAVDLEAVTVGTERTGLVSDDDTQRLGEEYFGVGEGVPPVSRCSS